jgi:hypothetical protein
MKPDNDLPGIVGTAVIDEDHFPIALGAAKHFLEALSDLVEVGRFVADRDHNTDQQFGLRAIRTSANMEAEN